MRILTQSIGVDISKDDFRVNFQLHHDDFSFKIIASRKFANTPAGITAFKEWMDKRTKEEGLLQIVMEATGRYHERLAYFLHEHHYRVCVVLPNKITKFIQSLNEYSKTDPIDAKKIAHYGAVMRPPVWQPASRHMRSLRELVRERQSIKQMQTQVRNRIHAVRSGKDPLTDTLGRLEAQLGFFKMQVEEIEDRIKALRAQDEVFNHSVELLTSIPHVGVITACCIIAETDNFTLFNNRNQLIKYVGLDVVEKQSGSSVKGKGRISKRGNAHLRSSLFMPAMGVARAKSVFQETFQRHVEKGQCKRKALMAVQRQLLLVIFGVHRSQQPYDENIHRQRVRNGVGEHHGSPTVAHLV